MKFYIKIWLQKLAKEKWSTLFVCLFYQCRITPITGEKLSAHQVCEVCWNLMLHLNSVFEGSISKTVWTVKSCVHLQRVQGFFLQQRMIKATRLRVFLTNVQTAMLRHRDSIKQTTDAQLLLTSLLYTWGYTHTHTELHWHDK